MISNNQMSIFGSSSSSAIEVMNQRPATQHVERDQREFQDEVAQKSKIIILRVPAASLAELDPPAKPSLIVKLSIKFTPRAAWSEIAREMQFMIIKCTFPTQRMFDMNLQPCILIDPSFAVRSALDDQTTDQRNLNSAAHAAANAQGSVRAKPPIALFTNKETREYALETYKLLEQPLAQFPGMPRVPIGRAYFNPEVDILHFQSKTISVSSGIRQGPTFGNFANKELIQRIAISNQYFETIDYNIGLRPVLLNYTSLREIIVLVPHLYCCIHGNDVRTSIRGEVFQHAKEHFVEKFKALVEGKWPNSMAYSWGRFPWVCLVRWGVDIVRFGVGLVGFGGSSGVEMSEERKGRFLREGKNNSFEVK
ncbi:hypothetical protein BOTCAL_0555g00060 [Botryotinia calthae]|uniref:2EXR domain-containing protein n=1 Tax=Botryotinia calthae TaxID=38488 RepID=A0A4Y8CLQ8_9HELO|nr:hypothetical protein BOTCAL_0555g00060 [Botryotinia calthae]